jgi:hypothetical protein
MPTITGNKTMDMSVESTIKVPAQLAEIYNNSPTSEQTRAVIVLHFLLKNKITRDQNNIFQLMDDIGKEAKENGLTEEILADILEIEPNEIKELI